MSAERPVEHLFFPSFLQNHSVMRDGLDLAEPRVLDRFLRFSALFSRGLVVADSDLNNNAIFHNAAQRKDGLFWSAVKTGYLRRAARQDETGNLLTQGEVADGLRKSSRWRFDLIPSGYPGDLDTAIAQAEDKAPPLIWTRHDVNRTFASKVLALLRSAEADRNRDISQVRIMDAIASWVRKLQSAGTPFGAADIESQLRPRDGSVESSAWDAVWPLVLEAHTGNIPLVFGGRLPVIEVPEAAVRMLPAGPEAGPEERAIHARLYAGPSAEQAVQLEVRHIHTGLPSLNISTERLDELSLEQVEELREAAEPEELLACRFRTAGSGEAMVAGAEAMRTASTAFLERLAGAGIVLTAEAERTALRSQLWGPADADGAETQIVAIANSPERAVEYVMMHSFPWPGSGPQVLGCDFTWLVEQVGQERARILYGGDIALYWVYKRPDFRVIELLGNE
jgi:hypothetical protein